MQGTILLQQPKKKKFWKILDLYVCELKTSEVPLSGLAKHIHTYLVSRPPNWKIHFYDIVTRATEGIDSHKNALIELENANLLIRYRVRGDDGRFCGLVFITFEDPQECKEWIESQEGQNIINNPKNVIITTTICQPHCGGRGAVDAKKRSNFAQSGGLAVVKATLPKSNSIDEKQSLRDLCFSSTVSDGNAPKEVKPLESKRRPIKVLTPTPATPIPIVHRRRKDLDENNPADLDSNQKEKLANQPSPASTLSVSTPAPTPAARVQPTPAPKPPIRGRHINGTVKQKAEAKRIAAPAPVKEIIDHWSELGLRQMRKPSTYNQAVRSVKDLLKGNFTLEENSPTYTVKDVKLAITNFAQAALNPAYEPTNGYKPILKSTSLSEFVFNPHASNIQSLFVHHLRNKPRLAAEAVPLPTPLDTPLANTVIKVFKDLTGKQDLTYAEHKALIEYANRATPYYKSSVFSNTTDTRTGEFAHCLSTAWREAYPDEQVLKSKCNIRFFVAGWTLETLLPQYVARYMPEAVDTDDSNWRHQQRRDQEVRDLQQAQEEAIGDYTEYFNTRW